MRNPLDLSRLAQILTAAMLTAGLHAQTVAPGYSSAYTLTALGSVTGVPTNYGGLVFSSANSNILFLGGNANSSSGRFYSVPVVRGAGGHVTSLGTGTALGFGTHNDGGIAYAPNGAILYAEYNTDAIGEVAAGGNTDQRTVSLVGLGVGGSPGPLNFVPPGFNGAGQLKVASYNTGGFYNLTYSPDGTGTYNISAATLISTLVGGPEGIVYVPAGSPLFPSQSLLIAEYNNGRISSYTIDSNGNPVLASRQAFVTGLTGAEGSAIDPVTGDLFFSTFGGGSKVIRVQGFVAPPPAATPAPSSLLLLSFGFGFLGLWALRQRARAS